MYNLTLNHMTRVIVRRMGNSIGLVLPKELVKEKGLKEGDEVDVDVVKARSVSDMWGALKARKISTRTLNDLTNEGEELG